MFKNYFFAATLLISTTLLQDTHACSTVERNMSEIYDSFDLVFAGNVTKFGTPDDAPKDKNVTIDINADKNVTIDITKVWKQADSDGLSVNDTITIKTGGNSALCGIEPTVGESWIIFTNLFRRASITESTLYTETLNVELDKVSAPPETDPPTENAQACGNMNDDCTSDDSCCDTYYCHQSNNKCKAVVPGHDNSRYLRSSSAR